MPGRLGGFSIEKYKKKHESFDRSPVKFGSRAVQCSWEKLPQQSSKSLKIPLLR